MADVRTVRNVELLKVGTWDGLTGSFTVTAEHLAAAIEAHDAGVLRKPPLKIGHDDPRFDGGPALGYVDNLRLTDGGTTLVGDLVNVPGPVAKLLPYAYTDRSIEAIFDYRDGDGNVWPFMLTALALLGASAPAVRNLKSLQGVAELYDVAAAHGGRPVSIAASAMHPEYLDTCRRRAVAVAAARRRRNNRLIGV